MPVVQQQHSPVSEFSGVKSIQDDGSGGILPDVDKLLPASSSCESPVRARRKLSEAPRTPTAFKKALADLYERGEPLCGEVSERREGKKFLSVALMGPRSKLPAAVPDEAG